MKKSLIFGLSTLLSTVVILPAQGVNLSWSSLGDVNLVDSETFQFEGGMTTESPSFF